jgi:hypothetical protein
LLVKEATANAEIIKPAKLAANKKIVSLETDSKTLDSGCK